jgi:hypothetical protein
MTLVNDPTHPPVRPWLLCAVSTFVAIPVWFLGLIALLSTVKPIDNPVGIPIYMVMCAVASVFVVPMNTLAIAPTLARLAFPSNVRTVLLHLVIGIVMFVLLWFWPAVVGETPALAWTILPFYMTIFLLPPVLVGSCAYSLRYNALNHKPWANHRLQPSGGSGRS